MVFTLGPNRIGADQTRATKIEMLLRQDTGNQPCPPHKSQDKPHDIWQAQRDYTDAYFLSTKQKHFRLWMKTKCGWKCGWSEKSENYQFPSPGTATRPFGGYLGRDQGSALHLTWQPHTLNALCSGMLMLVATTTKIKRGYFLPLPRPEISTLSWQQSESKGCVRVCVCSCLKRLLKKHLLP